MIVTDSVFSMDGDIAPLESIAALARRHGALVVVDEAHATGALGPGGRGAVAEAGLEGEIDVIVGTLSKALGAYGGYVVHAARDRRAARQPLAHADLLDGAAAAGGRGRARGARAARRAAAPPAEAPGGRCRPAARARSGRRAGARRAHADHAGDRGRRRRRGRALEALLARGVFAQAIRPPTVPDGSSRLRLAVMASHTASELAAAAAAIRDAARRTGVRSPRPAARRRRRRRVSGLSRLLRHRDRHGRRQDDPLRGAGREPARPRRAGAGAKARPDRARRGRPRRSRAARVGLGRAPEEVAPLRYGPAGLAASRGGTRRPADRRRRARGPDRRPGTGDRRGHRRPARPARERLGRARARPRARPRRLVAARPGLGTINHTLLTLEAARAGGLDVRAVVLTPWPAEPDAARAIKPRDDRDARRRRGRDAREVAPLTPAALAAAGDTLDYERWLV